MPQMKWAPQIRLRTIFLLFLCAAVGLATSADPLGALDPTIASAMVIGLLQQLRVLQRCAPSQAAVDGFAFARQFAIAWRIALTGLLAILVVFELLWGELRLLLADD